MQVGPKRFYLFAVFFVIIVAGSFAASAFAADKPQVIQIKAKRFEYIPNEITLKQGVPVVLELTSLDRLHGFNCPAFKIRGDVKPHQITRIAFTPDKVGTFEFHCDNFCGEGHEGMTGKFIVTE
jgi:cytochrome c oxidase subunit II